MKTSLAQDNMIRHQVHTWEVADHTILQQMALVPRSRFVDPEYAGVACADVLVKALNGAMMIPAAEVGRILTRMQVKSTESVAVVGAESGYVVALLAQMAHHVTWYLPQSMHEKTPVIEGVSVVNWQASTAFWQDGPFDVILVVGAVQSMPKEWTTALAKGGRLWWAQGDSAKLQTTWLLTDNGAQSQYETSWPWLEGHSPEDCFVL